MDLPSSSCAGHSGYNEGLDDIEDSDHAVGHDDVYEDLKDSFQAV